MLPILNFYSDRGGGRFTSDHYRLMVYHNQYLYLWHVNNQVFPNDRLTAEQRQPVGYFVMHQGQWIFVNQRLSGLIDKTVDRPVPIGQAVALKPDLKLLFGKEEGARLAIVQEVRGK